MSIWDACFTWENSKLQDESDGTKYRNWLHSSLLDKSAFSECIKTLSNNKSPGPNNGIVNELLRMLPTEIQDTIHMLFIIMWATGFTPKAWKISNTLLKPKKLHGGIFCLNGGISLSGGIFYLISLSPYLLISLNGGIFCLNRGIYYFLLPTFLLPSFYLPSTFPSTFLLPSFYLLPTFLLPTSLSP